MRTIVGLAGRSYAPRMTLPLWRVGGHSERGATLVEFALVVPLLAVLLFGIVDFGLVLNRDSLINNAAREGAREGSLNPDQGAIEDVVESVLSNLPASPVVTSTCRKPDASACTLHDADSAFVGSVAAGDTVIVTVDYDHPWITFVPSYVGLDDGTTLTKTIEMRVE